MDALKKINLKRISIQILIGSLLLAAVLAIYALLSGDLGEIELRILLTTVIMTGFSISLLAHAPILTQPKIRSVALAGITLSSVSFLMGLLLIWAEATSWGDEFIKTVVITTIVAIAATHASLLLQIKNATQNVSLARSITIGAIALLAAIISMMIIAEDYNGLGIRVMGATAVVVVVGSVITFLLSKFTKS